MVQGGPAVPAAVPAAALAVWGDPRQYSRYVVDISYISGVLRDNVNVTVERRASDDQLIALLAKDNPELEAALRMNLGAPDSFAETRKPTHWVVH